jgi:hypothetical protein
MKSILIIIVITGITYSSFAEVTNYQTERIRGSASVAKMDMDYISHSVVPKAAQEACEKANAVLMDQEVVEVAPSQTTKQYLVQFDAICMGNQIKKTKISGQRDPAVSDTVIYQHKN